MCFVLFFSNSSGDMAGLESWPAFQARALEIQMSSDFLDALKLVGIDSFGKAGFHLCCQPC